MRTVLQNAVQQKYKADAAIKFAKHTASVFRTKERRKVYKKTSLHCAWATLCAHCWYVLHVPVQVLGIPPCHKLAHLTTTALAGLIMNYMKAPESKKTTYARNLSLLLYTIFTFTTYLCMYTIAPSVHYLHILLSQNSSFDYAAQVCQGDPFSQRDQKLLCLFQNLDPC